MLRPCKISFQRQKSSLFSTRSFIRRGLAQTKGEQSFQRMGNDSGHRITQIRRDLQALFYDVFPKKRLLTHHFYY